MSLWSKLDREDRVPIVASAIGVVALFALMIGYYVWRDRTADIHVRIVSSEAEVAGCEFVTDVSVQVGNPSVSKPRAAENFSSDLARAETSLRQRAALAGANRVLVTSPGLFVDAKAYRCKDEH